MHTLELQPPEIADTGTPEEAASTPEPERKGVELSDLINAFEADADGNPDAPEPNVESLNEFLQKVREQIQGDRKGLDEKLGEMASNLKPPTPEPPEWARFGRDPIRINHHPFDEDEYRPNLVEYLKEEKKRREVEEEARLAGIERAIDNALKRAEERAQSDQKGRDIIKRFGFTPLDDLPPEARGLPESDRLPQQSEHKSAVIPSTFSSRYQGLFAEATTDATGTTIWEKFWKLTESNFFWGGGVGVALAAYAFEISRALRFSLFLLGLAWLVISISIFRHGFFEALPRVSKRIYESLIAAAAGIILIVTWTFLLPATQSQSQVASTSTPTSTPFQPPAPSPLPSVARIIASASPAPTAVPADYFNGRIVVKEGIAVQLSKLLLEAGYTGPLRLETLEFYNASEVNICWRTGPAGRFRCLSPGDGYNFPGGADATKVYIVADIDTKPGMKLLDVGLKARQD